MALPKNKKKYIKCNLLKALNFQTKPFHKISLLGFEAHKIYFLVTMFTVIVINSSFTSHV